MDTVYVAGLFDGEGYISIPARTRGYRLLVGMNITYYPTLKELQQAYGGHIYSYKPKCQNCKHVHNWVMTGENARNFLSNVLSHLKEKKQQAEVALNFPHTAYRRNPASQEYHDMQQELYEELKRLKAFDYVV